MKYITEIDLYLKEITKIRMITLGGLNPGCTVNFMISSKVLQ